MSTTTFHTSVQRSRFAHHALAALTSFIPGARRVADHGPTEAAAYEAQKVRDMAYAYSKTDPGFAADLYAAAARHEGLASE